MGKLTGTLMVRHDQQGIDLVIRQGKIVNSATTNHSRRLGQMLVYRRLLRRSDLDRILHEQQTHSPNKMLGQMILDRDLVSEDDLRATIKAQLEEEIWELFSWELGEFRFEHTPDDQIRDVMVEIDVEPLIIEGSRRIDEWKAIIRNLRGDDTVLALNEWDPAERVELTLTQAEWQVLSLINGFFSISSIAMRAGIGKFETYRILNAFLGAGICHIKSDPYARPQAEEGDVSGAGAGEAAPPKRRNLFGKRRGGPEAPALQFEKGESFATPIGLIARYVNLVAQSAFENREFSFAAGDEQFLERQWNALTMEYPMADLVHVEGNVVDASGLECYVEFDESNRATVRAYEDAVEALRRLYGIMATVFAQRMGEKTFQRTAQSIQNEWLPHAHVEQDRNFEFHEFLNRDVPQMQGVV
jgi:hypothetical protein